MAMTETSIHGPVALPPDVLVQRLPEDELVLLDLVSEEYFGLDVTGTAMWLALTETGDVDRARERLLHEFDVDPEVLRRDLDTFITRLSGRGLLRVGDDTTGARPAADHG
jgi:hypothetical protein